MKKLAILAAAALVGAGSIGATSAEASHRYYRHHHGGNGGAVLAGALGGLAAGALLSAFMTPAYAAPAYHYAPAPYPYRPVTRVVRVKRTYAAPVYQRVYVQRPVYRTRVVRTYPAYPYSYGYAQPYYRPALSVGYGFGGYGRSPFWGW